ncbi:MAG TPA: hypothetical protein VEZ24_09240 [Microvirga sp.]|nr:hypothetical protein [Microvirga sp.]
MAIGLLRFFGFISVLAGFGALGFSILTGPLVFTVAAWGVGMLLAGAPLLGFAYALELLETISRNTAPPQPASTQPPEVEAPKVTAAELFRPTGNYRGIPYAHHLGSGVKAIVLGERRSWKSLDDFKADIDRMG